MLVWQLLLIHNNEVGSGKVNEFLFLQYIHDTPFPARAGWRVGFGLKTDTYGMSHHQL